MSVSAQGVVERATSELSKRINGLALRTKHKASMMERVTNVLCGGAAPGAPEKPSRLLGRRPLNGNPTTPTLARKLPLQPVPPLHISWEQLLMDERFLARLFSLFTPFERRTLAQVKRKLVYKSSASAVES